jgi:hypothetical protein
MTNKQNFLLLGYFDKEEIEAYGISMLSVCLPTMKFNREVMPLKVTSAPHF